MAAGGGCGPGGPAAAAAGARALKNLQLDEELARAALSVDWRQGCREASRILLQRRLMQPKVGQFCADLRPRIPAALALPFLIHAHQTAAHQSAVTVFVRCERAASVHYAALARGEIVLSAREVLHHPRCRSAAVPAEGAEFTVHSHDPSAERFMLALVAADAGSPPSALPADAHVVAILARPCAVPRDAAAVPLRADPAALAGPGVEAAAEAGGGARVRVQLVQRVASLPLRGRSEPALPVAGGAEGGCSELLRRALPLAAPDGPEIGGSGEQLAATARALEKILRREEAPLHRARSELELSAAQDGLGAERLRDDVRRRVINVDALRCMMSAVQAPCGEAPQPSAPHGKGPGRPDLTFGPCHERGSPPGGSTCPPAGRRLHGQTMQGEAVEREAHKIQAAVAAAVAAALLTQRPRQGPGEGAAGMRAAGPESRNGECTLTREHRMDGPITHYSDSRAADSAASVAQLEPQRTDRPRPRPARSPTDPGQTGAPHAPGRGRQDGPGTGDATGAGSRSAKPPPGGRGPPELSMLQGQRSPPGAPALPEPSAAPSGRTALHSSAGAAVQAVVREEWVLPHNPPPAAAHPRGAGLPPPEGAALPQQQQQPSAAPLPAAGPAAAGGAAAASAPQAAGMHSLLRRQETRSLGGLPAAGAAGGGLPPPPPAKGGLQLPPRPPGAESGGPPPCAPGAPLPPPPPPPGGAAERRIDEATIREVVEFADQQGDLGGKRKAGAAQSASLLAVRGELLAARAFRERELADKRHAAEAAERLHSRLQAALKANQRPPYAPPGGLDPSAVAAKLEGVDKASAAWLAAAKESYTRQLETVSKRYSAAAAAVQKATAEVAKGLGKDAASRQPAAKRLQQLDALQGQCDRARGGELAEAAAATAELKDADVDEVEGAPALGALREGLRQAEDTLERRRVEVRAAVAQEGGQKVSPEKLAQIRETFEHFDTTRNGKLCIDEFEEGLRALGRATSEAEAKQTFERFAADGGISLDSFVAFMLEAEEDADSAQQVAAAFGSMRSRPKLTSRDLSPLGDHAAGFFLQELPPAGDGLDFASYIGAAFGCELEEPEFAPQQEKQERPARAAKPELADAAPGDQKERERLSFVKWLNLELRRAGCEEQVKDPAELGKALRDGVMLMHLIHAISKVPMPARWNKKAKSDVACLDNLGLALDMVKAAGIKLVSIGPQDLLQGSDFHVLALLWAAIYTVRIGSISVGGGGKAKGKEGLLMWAQRQAKGYEGVSVADFKGSWRDGLALSALVDKCGGGKSFDELRQMSDAKERIAACIAAAGELGVEDLIVPEDMLLGQDEKVVMAYIAEFFHVVSLRQQQGTAQRRVRKFFQTQVALRGLREDYERGAREVLDFAEESSRRCSAPPPSVQELFAKGDANQDQRLDRHEWWQAQQNQDIARQLQEQCQERDTSMRRSLLEQQEGERILQIKLERQKHGRAPGGDLERLAAIAAVRGTTKYRPGHEEAEISIDGDEIVQESSGKGRV